MVRIQNAKTFLRLWEKVSLFLVNPTPVLIYRRCYQGYNSYLSNTSSVGLGIPHSSPENPTKLESRHSRSHRPLKRDFSRT